MPLRTILSVHNSYQQPGGEDGVFAAEAALLRSKGLRVAQYVDSNQRISTGVVAAASAIWNQYSYRRIRSFANEQHPDVAHFHNTFPLISPAAYYAMRRQRIPAVQTLSNFRLICPGGLLMRNGGPCEECIDGKSLHPALIHGCYRNSRPATISVCAMITAHRAARTWTRAVDLYIALSRFARAKFVEGGFPESRVVVKPNFVDPDPGPGDGNGNYALFAGRLSQEKGICVLAEAWRQLPHIPLLVAGDGPMNTIAWPQGATPLGYQPRERLLDLMKGAAILVFPSIWYECAPLTNIEALATGLPVIASNIGSLPEFVEHHRTGLLFRAGDADDLAQQVRWAFDHPDRLKEMSAAARHEFEAKYTAEINYRRLVEIYEMAIENVHYA